MAIVKGAFQMTGSVGNISFYKIAGSDKVIMRTKGGPTKRRLKVGPEFELVRKHQKEWAACVLFSRSLRYALSNVYKFADFNVSPVWNGLGKNIMKADEEHVIGERSLMVSKFKSELESFQLNRNFTFNAVMGVIPQVSIDREALKGIAVIPKMNSEQCLLNIQKLPYFRLVVALGIISDLHSEINANRYNYLPELKNANGINKSTVTEWLSTRDYIEEMELTVELFPSLKNDITDNTTFILSMGIEFGNVGFGGKIEAVKRACSGRIMKVI